MIVKTLVAWGGHDFSYAHGEVIDLPDEIAQARIAEGLAEPWQPKPVSPWLGSTPVPPASAEAVGGDAH